jgi:hypothetical protein
MARQYVIGKTIWLQIGAENQMTPISSTVRFLGHLRSLFSFRPVTGVNWSAAYIKYCMRSAASGSAVQLKSSAEES